jgi:ubiquinone/menaquinone biosynthesis C-methylase UbiE
MLKDCASVYDRLARDYDTQRFENRFGRYDREETEAALRFLVDRFYPAERERVSALDVATGTGKISIALAKMGMQVTGLDAATGMLAQCAANARRREVSLQLKLGNAGELPFPSASFDMVLSFRFFHLFPPWSYLSLIREMARVTKPGGYLVVEFKNARYGLVVHRVRSLRRKAGEGASYAVTSADLQHLASECGLELSLLIGTLLPKGSLTLNGSTARAVLRQLSRGPLKGMSMSLIATYRRGA